MTSHEKSTSTATASSENEALRRSEFLLAVSLAILSVAALLWYYAHNELLLYGDAVAHINIARRVVDNRSWLSSFFQLGTVWLPLQHVAMLPFVWNNRLWQSGIAGSIPSMIAYVLGGLGIFRLVSGFAPTLPQNRGKDGTPFSPTLRQDRAQDGAPIPMVLPALVAAAIYAFNPNLLYMQATAMNEPIYLAFFIWTLVYLDQMLHAHATEESEDETRPSLSRERALERCGICLAGGAWTRYDGWFAGVVIGGIVVVAVAPWWRKETEVSRRRALAKSLIEVLLLLALVPLFWLSYNLNGSGKAMDWANGPYSAKAIAGRTTERGAAPYPGENHPLTAAQYFLKASQLNMGSSPWGRAMLVLAVSGTVLAIWRFRLCKVWLLLWLPLVFYSLSIAYGSVPIFVPVWWPFSYYNVRYGLELLPVFAVFPVLVAIFVVERVRSRRLELAARTLLIVCVAGSYLSAWAETPITLREARTNSRTRVAMEEALANYLVRVPKNATILMYEGSHVGALQRAGIPLKHVISEASHPDWEWALLDPAHKAIYIVAFQGDPVWAAAKEHRSELKGAISISVPGQERCTIYVPISPASPQTP